MNKKGNSIIKSGLKVGKTQLIALLFGAIIILGAALLLLPISTRDGVNLSVIDALFTATSATCVTGLVVVDTYSSFTLFGQIVVLSLIQIGGLGVMTMATLWSLILRRKISLNERLLIKESLNANDIEGIIRLTKMIIIGTFCLESLGAFLLSFRFVPIFGWGQGIFKSIFHSISAFCNAGFDLMGQMKPFSSLTYFAFDYYVNFIIMALITIGGLGFIVVDDIIKKRSFKKMMLHTKITLVASAFLVLFGFIMIFLFEYSNDATLGTMSLPHKLLASLFQSVTARTAGFNTIDYGMMNDATQFVTILLMFIGGSPGSTAGGIKTVTAAALILNTYMVIKGKSEVMIYKRRISHSAVMRANAIMMIAMLVVIACTFVLFFSGSVKSFLELAFEAVSAFGTVGLTVGATPMLNFMGKIAIIITMFFGRVGVMTMALAFMAQMNAGAHINIKYPEEKVMIG